MAQRPTDPTLGRLLRREMENLSEALGIRLTQEKFGELADVSRKHLSEVLNGKTGIEATTLDRIVVALNITGKDRMERIAAIYQAARIPIPEDLAESARETPLEYQRSPFSQGDLLREKPDAPLLSAIYEGLPESDQRELMQFALIKWQLRYPGQALPPTQSESPAYEALPIGPMGRYVGIDLDTGQMVSGNALPLEWTSQILDLDNLQEVLERLLRLEDEYTPDPTDVFHDVVVTMRDRHDKRFSNPDIKGLLRRD